MAMFNSYVSLPEGNIIYLSMNNCLNIFILSYCFILCPSSDLRLKEQFWIYTTWRIELRVWSLGFGSGACQYVEKRSEDDNMSKEK